MTSKSTLQEQTKVKYLVKTIFEQIDKPPPDPRTLEERIAEKAKSLAERLT